MDSEKKIFLCFFHYKYMYMGANYPSGMASLGPRGLMVSEEKIFLSYFYWRGQLGPQGLDWQDLCRGPLNIATY